MVLSFSNGLVTEEYTSDNLHCWSRIGFLIREANFKNCQIIKKRPLCSYYSRLLSECFLTNVYLKYDCMFTICCDMFPCCSHSLFEVLLLHILLIVYSFWSIYPKEQFLHLILLEYSFYFLKCNMSQIFFYDPNFRLRGFCGLASLVSFFPKMTIPPRK